MATKSWKADGRSTFTWKLSVSETIQTTSFGKHQVVAVRPTVLPSWWSDKSTIARRNSGKVLQISIYVFRQKVRCRLNGRKNIAKYPEGFPGTWFQGKVKSVPRSVGNLKASCHRPQRSHQDAGNLSYKRLAGKPVKRLEALIYSKRQRCMRCKAIHYQFDLVKSRIVQGNL